MKVLIVLGLTLQSISARDVQRVRDAAGDGAVVVVVAKQEDAMAHAIDADVVLGFTPRRMFLTATKLRWVHAISSGVDMFLYPEFVQSPVVLTSEKGLVGEHLADHAFALLLSLTRKVAAAQVLGPDGWQHREALRRDEIELTGAVLGVVGFGGTGRAVARRAAAFGMRCLAVDRDPVPPSAEVADVWPTSQLNQLLAASDVVAVCCPLTRETQNMFDAARFAAMKPGAFLINVTRGEVMVEDDLVAALRSGHLRGAGLDVAPREPLPADSALWKLPNVVMTPHTAGASQFRAARNIDRFVANLERLRRDAPLEGVIDKQLGY